MATELTYDGKSLTPPAKLAGLADLTVVEDASTVTSLPGISGNKMVAVNVKATLDKIQDAIDKANSATGPQGPAGTIKVGKVTSLAAGATPTVTNTGTDAAAVLNFGIPKGEKGDTGEKGDKGETGATGATGAPGATGATGPKGDPGLTTGEHDALVKATDRANKAAAAAEDMVAGKFPKATTTTLGAIIVGEGLSVDATGKVSANVKTDTNTTYTLTQGTDKHQLTFKGSDGTNVTYTIPDNDTTYSPATQAKQGLMSASDKTKLDNLEVIVVDSALSSTSTNPVQNKVVQAALNDKLEVGSFPSIQFITQANFNALTTKDPNTLYLIPKA